ncbi:MAG: hypothetical protein WA374_02580 [Acidobacteriaceae bacterium]
MDGFIVILRSAAAWGAFVMGLSVRCGAGGALLSGNRGKRFAIRKFKTENSRSGPWKLYVPGVTGNFQVGCDLHHNGFSGGSRSPSEPPSLLETHPGRHAESAASTQNSRAFLGAALILALNPLI